MEESSFIALGKAVRTHGLRGDVKIFPYGETLSILAPGESLFLCSTQEGRGKELTLASCRTQGKLLVVGFKELTRIEDAQEIIGEEICIPEPRLPVPEEGEYYHYQLIGLTVETVQGQRLGILSGIIETGGNDVYTIDNEGKELLIPAVEDIILEVDLVRGRMVIDPPEGLLDDL